jgi:sulfate permease, SulP family
MSYRFTRMELAGALGNLGTILPIAVALITVNHLNPQGVFLCLGLYTIVSGIYFRVTTPVEPMKVISAYAIARSLPQEQVMAAGLIIGAVLLVIGLSGAMCRLAKYVPKPAIRGVQLSTGILLMAQGVRFVLGTSSLQTQAAAGEPYLMIQALGPLPLNWLLGGLAFVSVMFLLHSRRFPAALAVVLAGVLVGIFLGQDFGTAWGAQFPVLMPFAFPEWASLVTAGVVLVLPQLPMTLGNAVIANTDLAKEYFGEQATRTTNKALCVSMGLANVGAFFLGGMAMCHGAGGLAAHYRFGARTAGANIMIGGLFAALALLLGNGVLEVVRLIPLSVLGVLLLFAGAQLAMTIGDMRERKDMFVPLLILGITLAANLALGFIIGLVICWLLQQERFSV